MAAVAHRFSQAQAWWIASQLVVRNPSLRLYEQVDIIDGPALVLELEDPAATLGNRQTPLRIVLDSEGVKLVALVPFRTLLWKEIFALPDPFDAVERIEVSAGLDPQSPAIGELATHALAYNLIALLLAGHVSDPVTLHVRSTCPKTLGVDDWALSDLSTFPSLEDLLIAQFELDAASGRRPRELQAWVVYQGLQPVAAFDEDGGLHYQDICCSLRGIQGDLGTSVHTVAMEIAAMILL